MIVDYTVREVNKGKENKAKNSLLITMLRNIILFIPCVIVLNALVGLKGAIAAQPVVETILAAICLAMYLLSLRTDVLAE